MFCPGCGTQDLGLVEWWIFAHSQWAVTTVESNFVRTAAPVGMGPRGIQERMDIVQHGYPGAHTLFRRDWFGKGMCPKVPCILVYYINVATYIFLSGNLY